MAQDNISVTDLAKAFRDAIAAAQPAPPVTFGEYISRPENREPELERPVFQHGQPIQIKGCSQDTIKHLNNLQPGVYLDGNITVSLIGTAPHVQVHIDYPWQTVDERMKIYALVSSFSDMVQKIAAEQKAKSANKT